MGNTKRPYTCIIGVPEGEEKRERAENLFEEAVAKNCPSLGKETVPKKMNLKRLMSRHIIKVLKSKDMERILKASSAKHVMYKGIPIRSSAYFSEERLQTRRE